MFVAFFRAEFDEPAGFGAIVTTAPTNSLGLVRWWCGRAYRTAERQPKRFAARL
jgi:hypothetical protein